MLPVRLHSFASASAPRYGATTEAARKSRRASMMEIQHHDRKAWTSGGDVPAVRKRMPLALSATVRGSIGVSGTPEFACRVVSRGRGRCIRELCARRWEDGGLMR